MSLEYEIPRFPESLPFHKQSATVPGSARPGQTAVYRNGVWPDLIKAGDPLRPASTTFEAFSTGLARSPNKPCLGHRPQLSKDKFADKYEWQTYTQVNERRLDLGSGIEGLFRSGRVGGGELPTVGIWCQNRPEWQIVDQAIAAYSKINVALYDTLGPDVVEYILNHAEISLAFVAANHLASVIALAPKCPKLRVLVSIDELGEATRKVASSWAKTHNVELLTLSEVEAAGKVARLPPIPPGPDDIATICYTSGTTNVPKGALLTHYNLVSGAIAFTYGTLFIGDGSIMSYLPLAHIYERINELVVFLLGGGVGFFSGDPLRLMEDAQILKPKFFPTVPRVLNRIALGIRAAAAGPGLKGALLRKALSVKLKNVKETGEYQHPLWDRLVFRKVKALLGGEVIMMTCGSAPVSGDVLDLVRVSICTELIEGWGMTETCAAGTRTLPKDPLAGGTVGIPHVSNELKLIDVPSMNYTVNDKPYPRGELCARGPCIFKGYYKDPKNTAEALDSEGWLHTGDIAELDGSGRIRIIDRLKNIMKLAQGEYVALEKIENTYSTCPVVLQLYVHGDSMQDHLIGVLVPEPTALAEVVKNASGVHVPPEDVNSLQKACSDRSVQKALQAALDGHARKTGLKGFEEVKRVHISLDPFTIENNMLTPTMKIRRRDVYSAYREVLDGIYQQERQDKRQIKL